MLKVESSADGKLVLRQDGRPWSRFGFGLAAALTLLLAYELVTGKRYGDGLGALIGGIATAVAIGIATLEWSRVEIDERAGVVNYRRRWAWKRYGGIIRLRDIERVMAERPITDKGIPSRRIVLVLRNGTHIPLTAGFTPDVGDQTLRLVERLQSLVATPR